MNAEYVWDIELSAVQRELKTVVSMDNGTLQERLAAALLFLKKFRWKSLAERTIQGLLEELLERLSGAPWEKRGLIPERDFSLLSDREAEIYWKQIEDLLVRVNAAMEASMPPEKQKARKGRSKK